MATRTFRRPRAATPQRRGRTWARNAFTQIFTSAGDPVAFDLLGGWATQVGATLPGLTVGPIHFHLDHHTGTAGIFWFGLIVANREAIAGDINAFDPSEVADRTLDWMFWSNVSGDTTGNGDRLLHKDYVTQSRRRINRVGESLYFIGRATAANRTVHGATSALVLLP